MVRHYSHSLLVVSSGASLHGIAKGVTGAIFRNVSVPTDHDLRWTCSNCMTNYLLHRNRLITTLVGSSVNVLATCVQREVSIYVLNDIFASYGIPDIIISDKGPQFSAERRFTNYAHGMQINAAS